MKRAMVAGILLTAACARAPAPEGARSTANGLAISGGGDCFVTFLRLPSDRPKDTRASEHRSRFSGYGHTVLLRACAHPFAQNGRA